MRNGKRAPAAMALLPLCVALGACTGAVPSERPNQQAPGTAGSAGAGGAATTASCQDGGQAVAIPKRLIRLSYAQLANGVTSLLGAEAKIAVDATKVVPTERDFQPLFKEGPQVSTAVLPKTMQLAAAAAGTVKSAAGCAVGDDACAQQAVLQLAERAYRRPLTADEQASAVQLYTELKAHGNSVEQAVSFATQGLLLAAPALYRTEFGAPGGGVSRLSGYETASQLSYFLGNGPPDAELLQAAQAGALDTDDGVRAQVDRLMQTEAVRENLKQAMLAYFEVARVLVDIKDGALYPEYTQGLRLSMLRESELFVQETLFAGKLSDLLTSRRAFVNRGLSSIYGVTYPGPATDLEDVFLPVELPAEQRSGLLTRAAFLAMRSRPDDTSVVARGLFVNATVLCAEQPPEPPAAVLGAVGAQLEDKMSTQKDKAQARATTNPCSGCHQFFDPYGLTLEAYDAIGRFRTSYATFAGMPAIDTSAQLPAVAGGALVKNTAELIDVITNNGRFSQCMAANLMRYALADDGLLPTEDCGVMQLNERFRTTDQSFTSLVREIAVAPTSTTRVSP
jgi:hypothetical protein